MTILEKHRLIGENSDDPGEYPDGMTVEMGFRASKGSYDTSNKVRTTGNLLHCYADEPTDNFVAISLSKSGNAYYVTSENPNITEYTAAWGGDPGQMCRSVISSRIDYYWRGFGNGVWRDWTG